MKGTSKNFVPKGTKWFPETFLAAESLQGKDRGGRHMGRRQRTSSSCSETGAAESTAVPEITPEVSVCMFIKENFLSLVGTRGFITSLHAGDFLAHVLSPSPELCVSSARSSCPRAPSQASGLVPMMRTGSHSYLIPPFSMRACLQGVRMQTEACGKWRTRPTSA